MVINGEYGCIRGQVIVNEEYGHNGEYGCNGDHMVINWEYGCIGGPRDREYGHHGVKRL